MPLPIVSGVTTGEAIKTQFTASFNKTTAATGDPIYTPASGKTLTVTDLIVSSYGITAARVIIWFGASADTTYTEGTDQALFKGSFVPSATVKEMAIVNFRSPVVCLQPDYVLRITTDAGISIDVVAVGHEA